MIVGNVARDLSLSGDVELFERAQRKQLFHFLLNWCRGEAMLQDEQTKRQLTSTLGQTRGVEKKKDYEKCVRDQTWVLQRHACAAAASLLLGRVFDEEAVHPNGSVFAWINSLLEQKERKALHGYPPIIDASNLLPATTAHCVCVCVCVVVCHVSCVVCRAIQTRANGARGVPAELSAVPAAPRDSDQSGTSTHTHTNHRTRTPLKRPAAHTCLAPLLCLHYVVVLLDERGGVARLLPGAGGAVQVAGRLAPSPRPLPIDRVQGTFMHPPSLSFVLLRSSSRQTSAHHRSIINQSSSSIIVTEQAGNQAIALRRNAIQLLQLVVPENVRYSPLPINSLLDVTYRRSQYELSQLLADQNPDMVCDFTVEMVRRLEMCEARGQRQLLGLLIPWLQCLNRNLHEPSYQPNLELIFEVRAQSSIKATMAGRISDHAHTQNKNTEFAVDHAAVRRRPSAPRAAAVDHPRRPGGEHLQRHQRPPRPGRQEGPPRLHTRHTHAHDTTHSHDSPRCDDVACSETRDSSRWRRR
jgi:hypothetical protein